MLELLRRSRFLTPQEEVEQPYGLAFAGRQAEKCSKLVYIHRALELLARKRFLLLKEGVK
ncbi:hypothetical protein ACFOU2_25150 [Bacillus songklensis]|uniref:Uncharacterized protein n=1 Tax=Bacillus songklensis TaxID=1069116 RepID=A0ABV8BBY8_9BACI